MPGIAKRIADDFRNRCGEPGLFGRIEFQEPGNLRGTLPRRDDVLIVMQVERQKGSHDGQKPVIISRASGWLVQKGRAARELNR